MGNDDSGGRRANLSTTAKRYLDQLGASVENLFHHVLAVLHDPSYREANTGALRMEWPRIPLPGWPAGGADGAAVALADSAAHGRELAALLDPETPVFGVTQVPLRTEVAVEARNMAGEDFAITAGWGHYGQGDAVMPRCATSSAAIKFLRNGSPTENAISSDGHWTTRKCRISQRWRYELALFWWRQSREIRHASSEGKCHGRKRLA